MMSFVTTPTDPTPHPQSERAAAIAKLITQLIKNDWLLAPYLQPITSQYFNIIQACSSFPNPPIELLTACLKCVAAMATKDSALVCVYMCIYYVINQISMMTS